MKAETFRIREYAYFDHKGMHLQFNVIDRATLLAAQEHPEDYEDLVVACCRIQRPVYRSGKRSSG